MKLILPVKGFLKTKCMMQLPPPPHKYVPGDSAWDTWDFRSMLSLLLLIKWEVMGVSDCHMLGPLAAL